MEKRDTWGDLYWLTLFLLSQATYWLFVVIGSGVSAGLGLAAMALTKSPLVGLAFSAWGLVTTLVGMGWIRFAWNRVLLKEER